MQQVVCIDGPIDVTKTSIAEQKVSILYLLTLPKREKRIRSVRQ